MIRSGGRGNRNRTPRLKAATALARSARQEDHERPHPNRLGYSPRHAPRFSHLKNWRSNAAVHDSGDGDGGSGNSAGCEGGWGGAAGGARHPPMDDGMDYGMDGIGPWDDSEGEGGGARSRGGVAVYGDGGSGGGDYDNDAGDGGGGGGDLVGGDGTGGGAGVGAEVAVASGRAAIAERILAMKAEGRSGTCEERVDIIRCECAARAVLRRIERDGARDRTHEDGAQDWERTDGDSGGSGVGEVGEDAWGGRGKGHGELEWREFVAELFQVRVVVQRCGDVCVCV